MSILNRSRKLVSFIFKNKVLLEQKDVFCGVCSASTTLCHKWFLPRQFTANVSSCQLWHPFFCYLKTRRCYSDMYSETKKPQKCQEESHDKPSETFTLDVLVSLLRQENAVDICVVNVPEQIKYAQYFIIVSGVSPRHLRAMALYAIKAYKFLKKDCDANVRIEGKDAEDWMCIDFGNMVVHFMLPDTREVYELEKLWTLRNYDEQLQSIPAEMLPEDFIYDGETTKSTQDM
ncbi:Mitochondrial assembly of ribosomal large subunit protein 1 [Channa argus]|uniref:Mitochondrial assembly of ribosomal large subunit protein 1 n=1 Tax=Channa argus TaxID=215402 RepID=A0A6G1PNQ4_CHAAH|nr:Mitochondrial assembly of ribosomal large subunit protein 1 [Channa argus]